MIIVFILSKQTTIWKFWNSASSNRHLELHRRCCLCTRFIHRFNQFKEENSVISWVSKTPAIKILWLVHTWSGICFLLVFREARRARVGFMSSQLSLGQTHGWYWQTYFLAWSTVQKLMILRQLSLSYINGAGLFIVVVVGSIFMRHGQRMWLAAWSKNVGQDVTSPGRVVFLTSSVEITLRAVVLIGFKNQRPVQLLVLSGSPAAVVA